MTNIKIITPTILSELDMLEYTFCVIPETMEAKIKRETPLDTPFSVINSPIRIKRIDPTVIVKALISTVGNEVFITLPQSK